MKANIYKYMKDWYIANIQIINGSNIVCISGSGVSHQKALEDAIKQVIKVQKGM